MPATGPPNARLVSLLIHNGWPFADHWEYFIPDGTSPCSGDGDVGTVVQAAGNVRDGFWLEIQRRCHLAAGLGDGTGRGSDLKDVDSSKVKKVPLQWVPGRYFETDANTETETGEGEGDGEMPACEFERALFRVPAPEKTLRSIDSSRVDDGGGEAVGCVDPSTCCFVTCSFPRPFQSNR